MTNTSSPLSRLVDIIEKLHTGNINDRSKLPALGHEIYLLGGVICDALEMDTIESQYSTIEITEGYQILLKMCQDAYVFVSKNSQSRSKAINLRYLDKVVELLGSQSSRSPHSVFYHGQFFSLTILEHLQAMSDNLVAYNYETILTQAQIEEATNTIDDLLDSLSRLPFDPLLKDRMVNVLSHIRSQILRINLIGCEIVLKDFDSFLGQTVRMVAVSKEDGKIDALGFFEKAIKVVSGIQSVVDSAQKMYPALETAAQAFRVLTQ